MDRSIVLTGLALVLLGASAFVWKVFALGHPVRPVQPPGAWQVEMRVVVHGRGEAGSVHLAVPLAQAGQRVFSAWSSAGQLGVSLRDDDDARVASFSGWMEDIHQIAYVFRIERFEDPEGRLDGPAGDPPVSVRRRYTKPEVAIPSTARAIGNLIQTLKLPPAEDRSGRIRSLLAFIRYEVADEPASTDDAFLTLVQREGNELGRVRLLVSLLRATGIPARVVTGLELAEGRGRPRHWAELWWSDGWVSASPLTGELGKRPLDWIAVRRDGGPLLESTGVRSVSLSVNALRAQLGNEDLAAILTPSDPLFAFLSLYRLPVATQAALQILLLLPLGALATSILRNVVGVPSYGTFMPMLIALALRGTGLAVGLLLVGVVIGIGVGGRVLMERLRLLLVPRLSILLCIVIVIVVLFALLTRTFDDFDFYAGIVFPIVILSMLIERFSLVIAEEGLREALERGAFSIGIALLVYPIFVSERLEFLMFGFPELVLVTMGILVFVGSYTGYRVSDWLRFRRLARRAIEDAS